ncbi:MAG TPA: hypothetical protein VES42_28805 [Pilimelia sp.]|nr:hypothetical protein [Pilimelia sp.]
MTDQQTRTRIPAPLYAAAGVGDLAYRQLRKLPTVVTELRGKATAGGADLRHRAVATVKAANETAADLRGKTTTELDVERLRAVVRASAQAAQTRATTVYLQLVAHGERVVGTGVVQAADTVNADMEATEAPAEITATPADVAAIEDPAVTETVPAKAKSAKRTRPAAEK